jgi:hypothetical protein
MERTEKVKEMMISFFVKHMFSSDQVEENIKPLVELQLEKMMERNPYYLTRMLDEKGIYVSIDRNENGFFFKVNGKNSERHFNTRIDAEREAIENALKILEEE